MTIHQILSEGIVHLLSITDKKKIYNMCINILNEVDLCDDVLFRYPQEIFWWPKTEDCDRQTLVLQPKLLILDEPTSTRCIGTGQRCQATYKFTIKI